MMIYSSYKMKEGGSGGIKNGKSAGFSNIPVELSKVEGEYMVNALTVICNKIWMTKEWQSPWT